MSEDEKIRIQAMVKELIKLQNRLGDAISLNIHRARELYALWQKAEERAANGEKLTFVGTYKDLYSRSCNDLFRLIRPSFVDVHPDNETPLANGIYRLIAKETIKAVEHTEEQVANNDWGDAFDGFFEEFMELQVRYSGEPVW